MYLESFVYAVVMKVMSLMVGITKETGADNIEGSAEMSRFVHEDVVLMTEEFKHADTIGADSVGFDAALKSEMPEYSDLDAVNKFDENVAFGVDVFDTVIVRKVVACKSPPSVGTITLTWRTLRCVWLDLFKESRVLCGRTSIVYSSHNSSPRVMMTREAKAAWRCINGL